MERLSLRPNCRPIEYSHIDDVWTAVGDYLEIDFNVEIEGQEKLERHAHARFDLCHFLKKIGFQDGRDRVEVLLPC